MEPRTLSNIFAGVLRREFIILPSGKPLLDMPGGNVLYAAVGFLLWEKDPPPGILARVGEDYPQEWLSMFVRKGIDTRGICFLQEGVDVRYFAAYTDSYERITEDPVAHFARGGFPFPKTLLGYSSTENEIDSRSEMKSTSLRQADIHRDYLDATAVHICSMDFLSHNLLPAVFRQAGFATVTVDPSPGYMNPTFWNDIPSLVIGLTAFLPSEEELRNLFNGHSDDTWEMAEALTSYGCEMIVIKCGERGQLLYDAASHSRWKIPAYPARLVDPVGAGDAFCGGFLAGYRRTYDPLQAVLYGNISASLVIEGMDPFYALEALPGLAQARLEAIRQAVRKV